MSDEKPEPERPPAQVLSPTGIASTTKVGAGDQASTDLADYKAVVERDLDDLTQIRYIPKDQPLDAGQELLSDPSNG